VQKSKIRELTFIFKVGLKPQPFTMDSPGVNCVDRHKENDPSRVALIWEKDERGQEERFTYTVWILTSQQINNKFLINKTLI
jgi:hypothetical protein